MYILVSFHILPSFDGLPYIAATGLTSVLITSAFTFKLAFTAEDSPELISGFTEILLRAFQGQSLIFRARLSRATNIPILLLSNFMFHSLQSIRLSVSEITITSILLQFVSFFAYGGSNAISSVDLSSAYNGIGGFNVIAVGLLTLISNWAGPIFWTSATNLLLLERYRQGEKYVFARHLGLLTIFTTLAQY
ncbi:major facilitator superfamily transporter protein [Amphichorda felina]